MLLCQLSHSSHGSAGWRPHGMGCHPRAVSQAGKIPAPCGRWVPAAGTPAGQVSAGAGLSAGRPCAAEPCAAPPPPAHTLLGVFVAQQGCRCRLQVCTGRQRRAARSRQGRGSGRAPASSSVPHRPRRCLRFVAAGKVEKGPRGASCAAAQRSLQAAHAPDRLRLRGELRVGKADGGRALGIARPLSMGLQEPLCQRETFPCRGSLGQTHPGPPQLAQLTLTGACFEGRSTEVKVVSCLEPREMLQSQRI